MTTEKMIDSAMKQQLENNIMDKFPEFAHSIGLPNCFYHKSNFKKELFVLKDNDKIWLSTSSYKLIDNKGVICDDIELNLYADLIENNQLVLKNVNFEFYNVENSILIYLVQTHKVFPYLSKFKELLDFVLSRSTIVSGLNLILSFNPSGELVEINVKFKYIENPNSFTSIKPYYTSSISLYSIFFNNSYSIKDASEALIFAKMFFLSVTDENFCQFFECDGWIELYDKFRTNAERMLSVYDMSRF